MNPEGARNAWTASGVSTASEHYRPQEVGPLPKLADVDAVHEAVRRVLANEPIEERQKRLISPGAAMGGARPKALFELDGQPWILKLADVDRPDEPLIEVARPAGFEPATPGFGGQYSIR